MLLRQERSKGFPTATSPYLAQLQEVPVVVDVGHQLYLGVKVLLLVDNAEIIQTQVGHVLPAAQMWNFRNA